MKLSQLVARLLGSAAQAPRFVGRSKTHDVSFTYRMGAGFPGDVTRISAAKIEVVQQDAVPCDIYGQGLILDATSHKARPPYSEGNTAIACYGISVRPYPLTENTQSPSIGTATPPTTGLFDVLRSGYILGKLGGAGASAKDGVARMWVAASSGSEVKGQWTSAALSASTVEFNNVRFNGPADANGVVELIINP